MLRETERGRGKRVEREEWKERERRRGRRRPGKRQ